MNVLKWLRRFWHGVVIYDDYAAIGWNGRLVKLYGGEDDIDEIFGREVYRELGVEGKNVVDVGASIGDTPIYFSLKGANSVYAYEMDEGRFTEQARNYEANKVDNVVAFRKEVRSCKDITIHKPAVLKMDIEGGEFPFFEASSPEEIAKFDEIIMEFHGEPDLIVKKLEQAGFKTWVDHALTGGNGVLYARKN